MDFTVVEEPKTGLRTCIVTIASATVIEAGDVCEFDSGLPIKGTDTAAKIAWSPFACASGTTQIELTIGNDFTLKGTGDEVFAVTQKGSEIDLVVDSGAQQLDVGASTYDVFLVDISENAGTVGSASNIRAKINEGKFLF